MSARGPARWMAVVAALMAVLTAWHATAGELKAFDRDTFAALAAGPRPRVVVFWSVNCAPCLAEMPLWARLRAERPDLRIALVSTDPPRLASRVAATLGRHGLDGGDNWAFASDFAAPIRFAVDPRWRGAVPRIEVFPPGGGRHTVVGRIDAGTLLTLTDGTGAPR